MIEYSILEETLENSELFYKIFSRFEFALKVAGFLIPSQGSKPQKAEVNWVEFSNSLPKTFFDDIRKKSICSTILSAPPQMQIVDQNKELGWKASSRPQNTQMLFQSVRCIRNNLFHGGKAGDPANKERNEQLIAEGIEVISYTLETKEHLKSHFNGLV